MFPSRFWCGRMFAGRFWPKVGATAVSNQFRRVMAAMTRSGGRSVDPEA